MAYIFRNKNLLKTKSLYKVHKLKQQFLIKGFLFFTLKGNVTCFLFYFLFLFPAKARRCSQHPRVRKLLVMRAGSGNRSVTFSAFLFCTLPPLPSPSYTHSAIARTSPGPPLPADTVYLGYVSRLSDSPARRHLHFACWSDSCS